MSDEDALLAALAKHAREAPHDPRLDALIDGRLSATEQHDLRADAVDDPALAAGLDLFTPLDAAAMDGIADHLMAHVIGAGDADADEADGDAGGAVIEAAERFGGPAPSPAPVTEPPAAIEPQPPTRRWWLAAPLLAAAAAVAFFVMRPTPTVLPLYGVDVTGGDVPKRGDDPTLETRVLRPESQLRIVLRPPETHAHPIAVRAFVHDGAAFTPWTPSVRTENGAALIDGTVEALGLTAFGKGPRTLVLQVYAEGESPGAPSLEAERTDVRQALVPIVLE